jgi:hypothetical protein
LARTREALHNGWDKNDPKDAQVILHMLRIGATQRYVDPLAAGINDLQELSKTHEVVSRMKTQTWHRILTHYLPLHFPEIARFAGNSRSDWFLALIERFPTPASITSLDREAFSSEAWPLIGRKVAKARLINDVCETACSSAALPVPDESAAVAMFRMVADDHAGLAALGGRSFSAAWSSIASASSHLSFAFSLPSSLSPRTLPARHTSNSSSRSSLPTPLEPVLQRAACRTAPTAAREIGSRKRQPKKRSIANTMVAITPPGRGSRLAVPH